jgi:anti-sigma B factor antagonist
MGEEERRMPGLEITTTVEDRTATMVVVGEVDMATAPQLDEAVAAAVEAHPRTEVDLTGSTYFDSSGLRVLFRYAERLAGVTVLGEGVLARTVEVAGLDQVLPVRVVDVPGGTARAEQAS